MYLRPTEAAGRTCKSTRREFVAIAFLLAAFGSVALVVWAFCTSPSESKSPSVPETLPPLLVDFEPASEDLPPIETGPLVFPILSDNCSETAYMKEGKVDISIAHAKLDRVYAKQLALENLFQMAYNNASGMCEGLYERVLHGASLRDTSILGALPNTTFTVRTAFVGTLSCVGCPDYEPLFANGEGEDSLLMGPDIRHDNNGEFFLRFYEVFNQYLPDVLGEPDAEVVYLASIAGDTGKEDHVLDIQNRKTLALMTSDS